jgi:hypothetical protein
MPGNRGDDKYTEEWIAEHVDEKRAKRMARFDETVAGVDDRSGQRQDPSRAGGRRRLDVSEETVDRLSRSKRPLDAAYEASERMSRLEPKYRKLRGFSEEVLPKHNRTIGSAQQFDWFDRAEPFERYEITRAAANQAGVGANYTSDPAAYDKMKIMRDEMLAVDPRSDMEMREKGAKMRVELERRRAFAREMRPAVRSNALPASVTGAAKTAGRWMGRLAWPLAAAGAALGVAEAAEGSSLTDKANAAVRGGFGLDFLNANRVLGKRLGLVREQDDVI